MHILVALGESHLGFALVKGLLAEGHAITILDYFTKSIRDSVLSVGCLEELKNNPKVTLIPQDLFEPLSFDSLKIKGISQIYHMACLMNPPISQADIIQSIQISYIITNSLLELAQILIVPIMIANLADKDIPQVRQSDGLDRASSKVAVHHSNEIREITENLAVFHQNLWKCLNSFQIKLVQLPLVYGAQMTDWPECEDTEISYIIRTALQSKNNLLTAELGASISVLHVADCIFTLRELWAAKLPGPRTIQGLSINLKVLIQIVTELARESGRPIGPVNKSSPRTNPRLSSAVSSNGFMLRPSTAPDTSFTNATRKVHLHRGLESTVQWFRSRLLAAPRTIVPGESRLAQAQSRFKDFLNTNSLDSLSVRGPQTTLCEGLIREHIGCGYTTLTSSATCALALAAVILDIQPGDEVIVPTYGCASNETPFILRGAKMVYVDIRMDTMNIDEQKVKATITDRTRAILVIHFSGMSCEMEEILALRTSRVKVIEDASHGFLTHSGNRKLGTFGDIACLSFNKHRTVTTGSIGGALIVNDHTLEDRAVEVVTGNFFKHQLLWWSLNRSSFHSLPWGCFMNEELATQLYAQLHRPPGPGGTLDFPVEK